MSVSLGARLCQRRGQRVAYDDSHVCCEADETLASRQDCLRLRVQEDRPEQHRAEQRHVAGLQRRRYLKVLRVGNDDLGVRQQGQCPWQPQADAEVADLRPEGCDASRRKLAN